MKKWIPMLLVFALLSVPMAGSAFADDEGQAPTSVPASQVIVPSQDQASAEMGHQAGSVPAQSTRLDAIYPPINALVLSMVEQGLEYDAQSDEFVWNVLYYMLSLYGQMDSRAQLTDDALVIPAETAQDYMVALFSSRQTLPPLPDSLSDRIRYDSDSGEFLLALGDAGLAECRLGELEPLGNGTYLLPGDLVSLEDESSLYQFQVTLAENESMFGYTILDLIIF